MNYYLIVPAEELDALDFSELQGERETQRLSIDGTLAIVERETFAEGWLTHMQALEITNGPEWLNPDFP